MRMSGGECDAFESPFPLRPDPELAAWRHRLQALSFAEASIRQATPNGPDGRRLWDLQLACEPIVPQPIRKNVAMIAERAVLLAEIDSIHVGFCVSVLGSDNSDPLFIQLVGVAPGAQHRGVGLALLSAAANREPKRDLALAASAPTAIATWRSHEVSATAPG